MARAHELEAALVVAAGALLRDRHFIAALLAGPLFWAGLLALGGPSLDLAWPARAPGRFAQLALVYPLLEEAVFRGLLQPALAGTAPGKRSFAGISGANWATSVLFACAHAFAHPPAWAAAVFFPSLVFGFFRDRYQSIAPGVALHVLYNTGYYWLSAPSS